MSQLSRETSKFVDKYDVTLDVCISSVLSQSKCFSSLACSLKVLPYIMAWLEANESIDVCVNDKVTNYINPREVQEQLHAKLVGVHKWDVCSDILDYDMLNLEVPTLLVVGSLIKLELSGDQGSVIPLTGSRTLVQKLARKLGLNSTVLYTVWFEGQHVCILITKVAFGTVLFFFCFFSP
ncbi:Serine carboxypeptidase-like 45 [Glycine soja]